MTCRNTCFSSLFLCDALLRTRDRSQTNHAHPEAPADFQSRFPVGWQWQALQLEWIATTHGDTLPSWAAAVEAKHCRVKPGILVFCSGNQHGGMLHTKVYVTCNVWYISTSHCRLCSQRKEQDISKSWFSSLADDS